MRLFLIYVIVEMAVIVALTATLGFGWTVLLLVGAFALGVAVAGAQLRRQLARLQDGLRQGAADPRAAVTDSALVALGSVLVFIPGLVSSVAGLLMLAPPTRAAMRPLAGFVAARGLAGRMAGGGVTFVTTRATAGGDFIDGEVIDVVDVEGPGPGPSGPAPRSIPPHRPGS